MIGEGKAHIHTLVTIAQAQRLDTQPVPAVDAFASLGNGGKCDSHEERDLHTWLKNLYDLQLEIYNTTMRLEAPLEQVLQTCVHAEVLDGSPGADIADLAIPTFLPHEILHALNHAGSEQAGC